jgi:hypothetical protein
MPESHEPSMIARLLFSLKTTACLLSSAAHYGRQIASSSRFSEWRKAMIIKQFAALAVSALALFGCATSLNKAAAGGATAAVVTHRRWCREHRFYRYDLAWHIHRCGFW